MDKILDYFQYIAAATGGFFVWLYGPWEGIIVILLLMITLDYITGILKAAYNKGLSSKVGYAGIIKKVSILIIVALGSLADKAIPATNGAAQAAICLFYIANEGLSVLENVAEMNVNIPKWIKELLAQIRDENDGEEPK